MSRNIIGYCLLCVVFTSVISVVSFTTSETTNELFDSPIKFSSDQPLNDWSSHLSYQSDYSTFKPLNEDGNWTLMFYLDGDINLEEFVLRDFNDIETGFTAGKNVTIIALLDRHDAWDTSDGNWIGSRIYRIDHDLNSSHISSTLLVDLGEVNMADPTTLTNFLDYCYTNYPADKTMLMLEDHGSGVNGIIYDDSAPTDCMTMDELQTALWDTEFLHSKVPDIIFMYACTMGMIEVAYELRGLGHYLFFSEEVMYAVNTHWDAVIAALVNNASISPYEFVEVMFTFQETLPYGNPTHSVIDLTTIDQVIPAINSLATLYQTIIEDGYKERLMTALALSQDFIFTPFFVDLIHFLWNTLNDSLLVGTYPTFTSITQQVLTKVNSSILLNYHNVEYYQKEYLYAYGLSIYFPSTYTNNPTLNYPYLSGTEQLTGLDWLTDSLWDEFLAAFYDQQIIDRKYNTFSCTSESMDFTITSSPIAIDIDADGIIEKIIASEHQLICCKERPPFTVLFSTNSNINSIPAVGDVDLDGQLELVFGTNDHSVYCLSPEGSVEWSFATGSLVISSACLADIVGDKALEILIGSRDTYLYCLSANGTKLWQYQTNYVIDSTPSVADLDGDGLLEVLLTSNGNKVYCLACNGSLIWSYTCSGGFQKSSPAIGDLNRDGLPEVLVACRDGVVYCLNTQGELEWNYQTRDDYFSNIALANIDSDPDLEILVSSEEANVYCFDSSGAVKWVFKQLSSSQTAPCVADIDGDGLAEVISLDNLGHLYVLDNKGTCIGHKAISDYQIYDAFQVMDIDKDSRLEILLAGDLYRPIWDEYGNEECITLEIAGVAHSGISPWWTFKGNHFHTGWSDSDGDWLDDFTEEYYFGTDPLNWDTDGDGLSDGAEYFANTDPLVHNYRVRNILIITFSSAGGVAVAAVASILALRVRKGANVSAL